MELVLQAIRDAGTDASSFRDNVRRCVIGAHRDGTVLGSYSITSDGDTTECMIQRYRINGTARRGRSALPARRSSGPASAPRAVPRSPAAR